jgi:hydrogenase expression/formation protein HypE
MNEPRDVDFDRMSCPLPLTDYDHVLLGHGSGGKLTADLIQRVFLPELGNSILDALEDQATVPFGATQGGPTLGGAANSAATNGHAAPRLAFTTDSFVVRPLFFPGGDIGRLAVHGTVNDLAVGGAIPLYLSAAFILEEGLPMNDLRRIVTSLAEACREANVQLVTGDTKVVDHGEGDQIFITTSGIGLVPTGRRLSIRKARPGDRVLVSGTIGDHGIAIMSVREGIEFETVLESDSAPCTISLASCWTRVRRSAACAIPRAAASRARSTNWPPPRTSACTFMSPRSPSERRCRRHVKCSA